MLNISQIQNPYLFVAQTGTLGVLDINNSSITPLGANEAFTGSWMDVSPYASVAYSIQTDVTSALGGIKRQWSQDGTNIMTWSSDSLGIDRIGATNGTDLVLRPHAKYFRIVYGNGAGAQSFFRLQTILGKYGPMGDTVGISHAPTDGDDALLTKAVLTGRVRKSEDGSSVRFEDVLVDSQGALITAQAGTSTAFGSTLVAAETVRVNLAFPYSVNPRLVNTGTQGAGTVTWSSGRAQLNTGAQANSSASLESRNTIRYVPGQGIIVRFTAVWAPGTVGSQQEVGIGDNNDGFFFGFSGSQFGVLRRRGGVDTWTAQSSWNGDDKFDGTGKSGHTLDPTKGYPYQIQYQWLGFGAIKFFIEDPKSGNFVLAHTIRYAGTDTLTSINNPTLPLHARILNTTNNTNLSLYTPSMSAISEGLADNNSSVIRFSAGRQLAAIPTTGASILNLRNKSTNIFGGTNTNRLAMQIDHISIRAATANDLYVAVYRNATITTPSWGDVETTTSVAEQDTTGTTTGTGGQLLMQWSLAGNTSLTQDTTNYDLTLRPGETLSFVVFAEATTVTARLSVSWREEQ